MKLLKKISILLQLPYLIFGQIDAPSQKIPIEVKSCQKDLAKYIEFESGWINTIPKRSTRVNFTISGKVLQDFEINKAHLETYIGILSVNSDYKMLGFEKWKTGSKFEFTHYVDLPAYVPPGSFLYQTSFEKFAGIAQACVEFDFIEASKLTEEKVKNMEKSDQEINKKVIEEPSKEKPINDLRKGLFDMFKDFAKPLAEATKKEIQNSTKGKSEDNFAQKIIEQGTAQEGELVNQNVIQRPLEENLEKFGSQLEKAMPKQNIEGIVRKNLLEAFDKKPTQEEVNKTLIEDPPKQNDLDNFGKILPEKSFDSNKPKIDEENLSKNDLLNTNQAKLDEPKNPITNSNDNISRFDKLKNAFNQFRFSSTKPTQSAPPPTESKKPEGAPSLFDAPPPTESKKPEAAPSLFNAPPPTESKKPEAAPSLFDAPPLPLKTEPAIPIQISSPTFPSSDPPTNYFSQKSPNQKGLLWILLITHIQPWTIFLICFQKVYIFSGTKEDKQCCVWWFWILMLLVPLLLLLCALYAYVCNNGDDQTNVTSLTKDITRSGTNDKSEYENVSPGNGDSEGVELGKTVNDETITTEESGLGELDHDGVGMGMDAFV